MSPPATDLEEISILHSNIKSISIYISIYYFEYLGPNLNVCKVYFPLVIVCTQLVLGPGYSAVQGTLSRLFLIANLEPLT